MILFIDDEKVRMDSYVQELILCNYKVEFKSEIDDAFDFFRKYKEEIELIILDIMMLPGEREFENCGDFGTRTGIAFYHEIRSLAPSLPVILFTNVPRESLVEDISADSQVLICHKDSYFPFELGEEVEKMLT